MQKKRSESGPDPFAFYAPQTRISIFPVATDFLQTKKGKLSKSISANASSYSVDLKSNILKTQNAR